MHTIRRWNRRILTARQGSLPMTADDHHERQLLKRVDVSPWSLWHRARLANPRWSTFFHSLRLRRRDYPHRRWSTALSGDTPFDAIFSFFSFPFVQQFDIG